MAHLTTYAPEAFDGTTGQYENASATIFTRIAGALAPAEAPPG